MLHWSLKSQTGGALLKHPGLNKLLKKKVLRVLLSDLERLVGPGLALGVYDLQGRSLAGTATLLPAEILAILNGLDLRRHAEPVEAGAELVEAELVLDLPGGALRTLMVNGELMGVLVATADDQSLPTSRCARQLDAAADLLTYLISQALGNRALAQETLERYREINLLYRIQEIIGSKLDLDQIASLVVEESMRVIKAATGLLLLLTPDQSAFDVQARHGQVPIAESCLHTDTIAGWVVRNRRAAIVNDVAADPRCGPADTGVRSLLCVPLNVGDQSVGALTLYDKAAPDIFTASDQKLLAALAFQAAVAIETAREVEARESQLKAQIRELRIEIDEIRKQSQVEAITATDYFARLQQNAQQMRREFEEEL